MIYYIEFSELFKEQIKKIKDKELRNNILNKVNQLKDNPKKGKYLKENLYELKAKNYRIYYRIYRGIVEFVKISYPGYINVERIGTKDSQNRDIKKS